MMKGARYKMKDARCTIQDAGAASYTLNPVPCFLTTKGTKKKRENTKKGIES